VSYKKVWRSAARSAVGIGFLAVLTGCVSYGWERSGGTQADFDRDAYE